MASGRRLITQTQHGPAIDFFDKVSKNGLADLVIDLVRLIETDEDLDGPELLKALEAAWEPVRIARGDRKP